MKFILLSAQFTFHRVVFPNGGLARVFTAALCSANKAQLSLKLLYRVCELVQIYLFKAVVEVI